MKYKLQNYKIQNYKIKTTAGHTFDNSSILFIDKLFTYHHRKFRMSNYRVPTVHKL